MTRACESVASAISHKKLCLNAGHFLLTELLLDTMRETAKESGIQGRIVIVSGHLHNFTPKGGIAFDKLINQNE